MKNNVEKMHRILLEDIIWLDKMLSKYHINYMLSSGTLLGAIRHQGFVPWDDDLDIIMTRKNYDKLIKNLKHFETERYHIRCYKNSKKIHIIYAHLVDKKYLVKHADTQDYLHMDIYACDYIKESYFAKTKLANAITRLLVRSYAYNKGNTSVDQNKTIIKKILLKTMHLLTKNLSDAKFISRILRIVGTDNPTSTMSPIASPYGFKKEQFPSEYYTETTRVPFEGHSLPVSKHYDQILKQLYGNYMELPPKNQRNPELANIEIIENKLK